MISEHGNATSFLPPGIYNVISYLHRQLKEWLHSKMRTCDRLYCCPFKQQITLIVFPKELLLNCRCFCPKIWTPVGDLHHTIRLPAAHHLGTSITPYGTCITPSGDLHLHHTIQEPASRHPAPSITSFGAQHRINVRSRRCTLHHLRTYTRIFVCIIYAWH